MVDASLKADSFDTRINLWHQCFSKYDLWCTHVSLDLLEMPNLRPYLRYTASDILGLEPTTWTSIIQMTKLSDCKSWRHPEFMKSSLWWKRKIHHSLILSSGSFAVSIYQTLCYFSFPYHKGMRTSLLYQKDMGKAWLIPMNESLKAAVYISMSLYSIVCPHLLSIVALWNGVFWRLP